MCSDGDELIIDGGVVMVAQRLDDLNASGKILSDHCRHLNLKAEMEQKEFKQLSSDPHGDGYQRDGFELIVMTEMFILHQIH